MTLLKFSDVSLAFGAMPLLDKVSWQIARGERVCIIGRNGTGKSSMMKLVKGDQKPDDGAVWRAPGLKIGELPQELPVADERTVFDVVADGFGLPRAPRLSRDEARTQLSAMQWSFMSESRRLVNQRLKTELRLVLRHATVQDGLGLRAAPQHT